SGNSSCTSWCAVLRWSARLLSISVIARASIARSPERTPRTRSADGRLREAIDSSSPGMIMLARGFCNAIREAKHEATLTFPALGRGAREGIQLIALCDAARRVTGALAETI